MGLHPGSDLDPIPPSLSFPTWKGNKTDANHGSYGISPVNRASGSLSPDPQRSSQKQVRSTPSRMKKWSLVVAALYGAVFVVLGFPFACLAFFPKGPTLAVYAEGFLEWQPWALVALVMVAQLALLRVPVAIASGRPVARRSIWSTAIAAAFMMGLLVLGAAGSIFEFLTKMEGIEGFWLAIGGAVVSWGFWAYYFYRVTSSAKQGSGMVTLRKHLWTGSILELLIAIPTHIIARQRDYCCAGIMTFLGLTCGFAVMLFAFGPALYFLFMDRWRRIHPQGD